MNQPNTVGIGIGTGLIGNITGKSIDGMSVVNQMNPKLTNWITNMTKKQITTWANKEKLTIKDFRHSVRVLHGDGSYFHFCWAKLTLKHGYLIVFTEHNGIHIFDPEDLDTWEALKH